MPRKIDWESQIGRRLRFRDLHVFFTVAQCGTMAKAAAQLGVSAPTVSEVIADLEAGLGVRLLDRGPQGIEPTVYGEAFRRRGLSAFDELKQGIRDIEFLADPTSGELRIGCEESIAAATLPPIIQRFSDQFPGVVLDVDESDLRTYPPRVRERGLDLAIARLRPDMNSDPFNELNVEVLFNDHLVVAAGIQTRWARRRTIDLTELASARWILSAPNTWNYQIVEEAFRARGLNMPKVSMKTLSVHLRANLVATGQFITAFPHSVLSLYASRFALRVLPLELPARPWPVVILTLRHRTLTPVVERFIECAREVVKSLALGPKARRLQPP
jgi:DNA-binding transcriptional LysR family regulator